MLFAQALHAIKSVVVKEKDQKNINPIFFPLIQAKYNVNISIAQALSIYPLNNL